MKKFTVLIFFFFCHFAVAQDPFYINYGINEGLPSATVYSVSQDDKGYLWFTTDAGIVKFDSHSFTLYNTDNGLSDNEVFDIKKDYKGRNWLLTLNGKPSYFYNDKIYNESNSELIRKIAGSSMIIDFYQYQENLYFVYRNGEIAVVTPNDEVLHQNVKTATLSGIWKHNNSTYLLTGRGVFDSENKAYLPNLGISSYYRMYHIGNNNYISQGNTLFQVLKDNTVNKMLVIDGTSEVLEIFVENPNKIWICTRDGLYLYQDQILKSSYFSGLAISGIVQDFEGGYWISTLKKGLLYVPSFDVFSNQLGNGNSLKLNCISVSPKQEIWIGGDKNDYYTKKKNEPFVKKSFVTQDGVNKVANIRFFNDDTYIVGKLGVVKIDASGKTTNYGFSGNDVLVDGKDFFLAYSQMFKIPIDAVNVKSLSKNTLINKRATVLTKGNNEIWIGSNYGLYQYTKKDSVVYWSARNEKLQTTIQDLYYDKTTKSLLVATGSKGIVVLRNHQIETQLSTKNGLNSITCNTIKKIAENYYLIGSNNGLNSVYFDKDSLKIKNLNAILGLRNTKINDIEFLDGIVYLASDNGLLQFNLNNLIKKKSRPICLIENLKSQDKIIPNSGDYQFTYNHNDISISYVGISYVNQNNITYHYQLDGQNDSWSSTKESQINYKSLSPGKYCFKVYCVDGFGVKSHVQQLNFEILSPFWQKTWFVILIILVLSFVLYAFVRHRLKVQQQRFEKEKAVIQMERDKANLEREMIDLEQKALRLQMNPHFIFNALNTIKGYYSEGDTLNASTYISKFSKLLRMLLENTEQTIPLSSEIEMLELYIGLTKTRYKDKFEYVLFVDADLNRNETAIPTLLLQPIVENAIIHGLAPKSEIGLLKISFVKKENRLECIVEDNGVGREAAKRNTKNSVEHESKAIAITTERIRLFSKNDVSSSFEIIDLKTNGIVTGTKVIITIPLISIW